MEETSQLQSLEQARNAAIRWLETRGVVFGPHRDVVIGRLGEMEGSEAGVSSTSEPFWRLRLDYDPSKGCHYNAEFGKGQNRAKHAFLFPGSAKIMATLARHRAPR